MGLPPARTGTVSVSIAERSPPRKWAERSPGTAPVQVEARSLFWNCPTPRKRSIMKTPHLERNRRILVIDDNRSIHGDFRKILTGPTAAGAVETMEEALFGRTAAESHAIEYEMDSAYQG